MKFTICILKVSLYRHVFLFSSLVWIVPIRGNILAYIMYDNLLLVHGVKLLKLSHSTDVYKQVLWGIFFSVGIKHIFFCNFYPKFIARKWLLRSHLTCFVSKWNWRRLQLIQNRPFISLLSSVSFFEVLHRNVVHRNAWSSLRNLSYWLFFSFYLFYVYFDMLWWI
jgi:hypothetical protein